MINYLVKPEKELPNKVSDNTIQFYGEYGLTDKTTLLAILPFKMYNFKYELLVAR